MDPGERAREVAADIARWRDRRWCRCRIARANIAAIVETIDPARKPRMRVVDDARDAIRLRIQLYDDFAMNRDVDNTRLSALAAASARAITGPGYRFETPDLQAMCGQVSSAASTARDAIDAAFCKLTADCPTNQAFRHSFASPIYAFEYRGRSRLLAVDLPSPYLGITELYLGGCYPLGYVDGHFVVFAP